MTPSTIKNIKKLNKVAKVINDTYKKMMDDNCNKEYNDHMQNIVDLQRLAKDIINDIAMSVDIAIEVENECGNYGTSRTISEIESELL